MGVAADLLLRLMQALQDLALVRCERRQHLRALAAHAHQADRRLWVARDDILKKDIDGVALRVVAGRCIVAVPAALAVVHHDHHRLETHLGELLSERGGIVLGGCAFTEFEEDALLSLNVISLMGMSSKRCGGLLGWLDWVLLELLVAAA